jgi:hypothetical protein
VTFLLEVSNDNDLVALAEFDLLLFVGGEFKAAVAFPDSYCTNKKLSKILYISYTCLLHVLED